MLEGRTKVVGILLLLLFFGGILIPTIHEAHCKDHCDSKGDSHHCPLCQILNTPCITSQPPITLDAGCMAVGMVLPDDATFVSATPCNSSQARAPPVA